MNKFLLLFLTFLSTFFFFNQNFIFIGIFLFLFCFYKTIKNYKKDKIFLTFFAIIILYALIRYLLSNVIDFQNNNITGLVISKKKNYLIIQSFFKKYYVYSNNQKIDFFDIVKLEGDVKRIQIHEIESNFSFNDYLVSKGIYNETYCDKCNLVFDFPFNVNSLKLMFLSNIKNSISSDFIGCIFFSEDINGSEEIDELRFLNLTIMLSLTGSYLNYVIKKVSGLFSLFLSEKVSDIIGILFLTPLFILNIDKFTTYKVIFFFVFNFINKYYLNYRFERIEVISIIGLLFLIFDPYFCFQEGFLLSFIILFFFNYLRMFKKRYKRIKLWLINLMLITIIVLPFQINRTNTVNIFSIVASMLVSSIMKPLFIVFYIIYFYLKLPLFNSAISIIIAVISKIDFNVVNINIPKIPSFFIFIYYLFLIFIFYFTEVNRYKITKYSVLTLVFSISIYAVPLSNFFTFQVSYIDVGQGDSTLIRYREKSYLIDTGGLLYTDVATNTLIPYLRKNRIYKLNGVIITHSDYDHNGALGSLCKHFPVCNVYDRSSVFPIVISDNIKIDNLNTFTGGNDENYNSLVLKFSLKNTVFLFMGDAPKEIETKILKKYKNLKCDYLKVGHHGSDTSSSEAFINYLKPKVAIISCGYKNKFNHPSYSVLKILEHYDVNIRRTDLEGTIYYKFWI